MKCALPLLGAVILTSFSPIATAQEILAEIFTSTNCVVCETAETQLSELAADPDVIAIAYHVDYLDYLGEEDPFANPVFSSRQIGYNSDDELKTLTTPQIFINGEHTDTPMTELSGEGGEDKVQTSEAEEKGFSQELTAIVSEQEDGFEIHFEAADSLDGRAVDIVLVELVDADQVESDLAERFGGNVYVVQSLTQLARWDGKDPLDVLVASREDEKPMVIFAQLDDFGEILYTRELSVDLADASQELTLDGPNP